MKFEPIWQQSDWPDFRFDITAAYLVLLKIAEKALSQGFGYPVFLSLSTAIEAKKKDYYSALSVASKSNEITAWIIYFVNLVLEAQQYTEEQISFIVNKADFFDKFKNLLNERQKHYDKSAVVVAFGMSLIYISLTTGFPIHIKHID